VQTIFDKERVDAFVHVAKCSPTAAAELLKGRRRPDRYLKQIKKVLGLERTYRYLLEASASGTCACVASEIHVFCYEAKHDSREVKHVRK